MHHARYVQNIIRNINPNSLTDLSVGVLAGAHHRRRSSGPRRYPTAPLLIEEALLLVLFPTRLDHNIGAVCGERNKKFCFHLSSTMVGSTRNRDYNDPSVQNQGAGQQAGASNQARAS
jgi:hypothetical protein